MPMRYCPECQAEYVEGVGDCVDCGVKLVERLPGMEEPSTKEFDYIGEFETIYEDDNNVNAQMVYKLLDSNGFACKLIGANEVKYPPTMLIVVQVQSDRAEEAREVIAAYMNTPSTEFDAMG